MIARRLLLGACAALPAFAAARAPAQPLTDFRYKAAHNAFERPYESPFGYDDLVGLYHFNLSLMAFDLANGHLFHMITSGDERIPLGFQVGWLNTWSLELDLCSSATGSTRVRHFPGMEAQSLPVMLGEYWNGSTSAYRPRDRFTIFWFEWKTDSDCDGFSNAAMERVRIESLLAGIPPGVVFTPRDLLLLNGLDPDVSPDVGELTWPSPQWLWVNGYRVMYVSQDGYGGRFMFTGEFSGNDPDTDPGNPPDDGQLWRLYPDRSSAAEDFVTTDINEFLGALGQFNPWGYTRDAWETGLSRGYNIVATNDINDVYSVHWGDDYPDGYRWAPPMPMYVGGPVFWADAVPGTVAEPYSKLRLAEYHLRHTETIRKPYVITDPWPVLLQGGTHSIDHVRPDRFEPQIPMRLEAKDGQTVRLVPGGS